LINRASDSRNPTLVIRFAARRSSASLRAPAVEIDSHDWTLVTNQGSHKEANIADAATDIKHMHAALNSSREQHPLCQRPKQLRLLDQPRILGLRSTRRHSPMLREFSPLALVAILYSLISSVFRPVIPYAKPKW
jgi:hypothetical protein